MALAIRVVVKSAEKIICIAVPDSEVLVRLGRLYEVQSKGK